MRVLAVDDDEIILELLEAIVGQIPDVDLETACGPEAAIAAISAAPVPFECLLFDIQMPYKNGIELCREVRAMQDYKFTPIIMITAMSDKSHIDDAFAAGATDYVTKPFDMADVQTRLKIAQKRSEAQLESGQSIHFSSRAAYPVANAGDKPNLFDHIAVFDVPGLVEPNSLMNYLSQLSRANLFGSGIFAISIRRIEELYLRCDAFEFEALIADVAEAISDCLRNESFLFSYGGNGTFDCVVHGGRQPDLNELVDQINIQLQQMGLCYSDGTPQQFQVLAGDFYRLVWRSSGTVGDVLADAHHSAEQAAIEKEKQLDDFWFAAKGQTAV